LTKPSIFPILLACSIFFSNLTTSCQSSNVVVVVWGLLETFHQLGNLAAHKNMQHRHCQCVKWRVVFIRGETNESEITIFPLWFLTDGGANRHLWRKLCSVEVLVFFMFFQSKSVSSPYFLHFQANTDGRKL
jgi:hypothetical protein